MQGYLPITFLNQLLSEVANEQTTSLLQTLGRGLSSFSKGMAVIAVEKTLGETLAGNLNDKFSGEGIANAIGEIKRLKEQIQIAVEKKLEKEKKDRIIFFIDDLDRLPPEVAVEILEVLKIFLDVPKTVFVLAVDYDVVVTGIQNKYGEKIDSTKGKSFFDKIIQLPFTVPLGQYNISKYIFNLLEKMGIKEDEGKISFEDLIRASIGCNPRSIKRVFNAFYLLNTVAELKGVYSEKKDGLVAKRQKILFGVLCLQLAFEPVYEFIISESENLSEDFFSHFTPEKILSDNFFENLRTKIKADKVAYFKNVVDFMDLFFESIQLDENSEALSQEEIENLRQILNYSSITANSSDAISVKQSARVRLNNWSEYQEFLSQHKMSPHVIHILKKIHDAVISLFAPDQIKVQYAPTALSFQANISKRKRVFWFCGFKKNGIRIWSDGNSMEILNETDFTEKHHDMIKTSYHKIIATK